MLRLGLRAPLVARNKIGPIQLPCGTPQLKRKSSECTLSLIIIIIIIIIIISIIISIIIIKMLQHALHVQL